MFRTGAVVILVIAGLGLLMWALVGPDVEGIPTRIRPYGEGAFLVFPKYRDNTYSLALQSGKGLHPYPSRHAHEKGLITNAVDIHLDSRGTLWVLDSGVVRTLGRPTRKSNPRVLALDAETGEIKQTIPLDGLVRGRAQFLEVEESVAGPERLYISDGPSRCIAVWDVATRRGRRLLLPRAVSHPSDVLYLALVPPSNLYFTFYKSPDMYVMNTRDERGVVRKVGSKPPGVILIGREGRNILFRVSGSQRLYAWNTQRDLSRKTFKQRDAGGLGDPLHAVGDTGRTWVLEADLSAFLSGKKVSHRIRAINHTQIPNEEQSQSPIILEPAPPSSPSSLLKEKTTKGKNLEETTSTGKNLEETTTTGKNLEETTTTGKNLEETTTTGKTYEETTTTGKNLEEITTTGKNYDETTTTGKNLEETTTIDKNYEAETTTGKNYEEKNTTGKNFEEKTPTKPSEFLERTKTSPQPPSCPPPTSQERELATPPTNFSTNNTVFEELPPYGQPEVVLQAPPTMAEEISATTTSSPLEVEEVEEEKKLTPSPLI